MRLHAPGATARAEGATAAGTAPPPEDGTGRVPDPVAVGTEVRALAYPDLVGTHPVGSGVLLNVSALARGLGTGGYALVVGPADGRVPADPPAGPGHLVKARYTPQQVMVLGVDDQESAHHAALADADDLAGLPVVVADLHSAVPAVVAGVRAAAERDGRPTPRVVYVMTDGGALPAAFSRTVAVLRESGWLTACVTAGQAYGGDLEAVTVHTALLAARLVAEADVVVVAQGPGNLGTGTRWGFSGIAAGEALNAAGVLGGRPVASLRVSAADARERHLGVSHHSTTAYGRVALSPADVVVPVLAAAVGSPHLEDADGAAAVTLRQLDARIRAQVAPIVAPAGRHTAVEVPADHDVVAALAGSPVRLSTMGRGFAQDPVPFLAAAVAGVHAAGLAR